jgi:hypothetical protein
MGTNLSRKDADAIETIARRERIQFAGGVAERGYVTLEVAVHVSKAFEPTSSGVNKTGAGIGRTSVTRRTTAFGALLNCIVTRFDGYEKLVNALLRAPAVTTVKVSFVAGEKPGSKSTLNPPFKVMVPDF